MANGPVLAAGKLSYICVISVQGGRYMAVGSTQPCDPMLEECSAHPFQPQSNHLQGHEAEW